MDYNYEPFNDEWFYLQHIKEKRKVDHVVGKSKDVSDAWVGAIQNCIDDLKDMGDPSDTGEDYSYTDENEEDDLEWRLEDLVDADEYFGEDFM